MKFIMMIGISGSGKSTVAQCLVRDNTVLLSSDSIRAELFGSEEIQKHPEQVFALMRDRTVRALSMGADVIYDATNTDAKLRTPLLAELRALFPEAELCAMIILTPLAACLENQKRRSRMVPENAVRHQACVLRLPTAEEGFDQFAVVKAFGNPAGLPEASAASYDRMCRMVPAGTYDAAQWARIVFKVFPDTAGQSPAGAGFVY